VVNYGLVFCFLRHDSSQSSPRRRYGAQFKFQVVLDAVNGTKTIDELAREHSIHPNEIRQRKRQLLEAEPSIFGNSAVREQQQQEAFEAELFEQVGRLKMELEWLKKRLFDPHKVKRVMIEFSHAAISIRRQYDMIEQNRSAVCYRQPVSPGSTWSRCVSLMSSTSGATFP
jgi:putative transposase